jgi:hypothetical protein
VARTAPMDRLQELSNIGERFDGQGPLLVNEFEEYAKHFARDAQPISPYETWTPAGAKLRRPRDPIYSHAYDLDQLTTEYVERWPLLAVRRSPAESRPPSNYERVWSGRFYEVWRRKDPAPAAHEPLGHPPLDALATPACADLRKLAGHAPAVVATRPRPLLVDLGSGSLPSGWRRGHTELLTQVSGTVSGSATTGSGRHELWVKGTLVRRSELLVDGRAVGTAKHVNGPNQWIDVGPVDLRAGRHTVELRRPEGSLAPGDKGVDEIGPAALVPAGAGQLVSAPAGRPDALCGRPLDWLDRPRGTQPQ